MITTMEQFDRLTGKGKRIDILKRILKGFYIYLAIVGIFSFSLFIMEESCQTITFATFSAKDANRYDIIKSNYELMANINSHMRILNKALIFLQPITMFAYSDFSRATDQYIATMKAVCIARDPGLYVGERITINFQYKKATRQPDKTVKLLSNKIVILVKDMPIDNPVKITGVMALGKSNKFVITADCPPAGI